MALSIISFLLSLNPLPFLVFTFLTVYFWEPLYYQSYSHSQPHSLNRNFSSQRIDISNLYKPYKFNTMSELIKFHLPKVKLKVKTTSSEDLSFDNSTSLFKEYSLVPCSLQERLKMKKQIQESYLKFRRKKKSNYRKHNTNNKKDSFHEEERHNSLLVKNKTNPLINHTEFALEVDSQNEENNQMMRYKIKDRVNMKTPLCNKKRLSQNRELLSGSYKEASQCLKCSKNNFLQGTQRRSQFSMQLQGKICKYTNSNVHKKILKFLQDNNVRKNLKKTTKFNESNSFKIDPWRADNMSKLSQEYQRDFRQ